MQSFPKKNTIKNRAKEQAFLAENLVGSRDKLVSELTNHGVPDMAMTPLKAPLPDQPLSIFAFLLAGVSLTLQRATGHAVDYHNSIADSDPD
ncbi:MAG: hypothetical protein GY732_00415, partial [Gammaproteobacteria bacterium]|nr:hypothetical protein [Gammaproteobacteria bacterium]